MKQSLLYLRRPEPIQRLASAMEDLAVGLKNTRSIASKFWTAFDQFLTSPPRRARPGDSSKRCETIKGDMQSVFHGGGFLQKRRSRSQLICTTVPCRKEHSPSPSSPQAWASVVAVSRYRFISVRRPCCHLHPLQRALAAKPSPSVGRTFHITRECTLDTAAISAKSSNTVLFVCRVCFSVLRFICS